MKSSAQNKIKRPNPPQSSSLKKKKIGLFFKVFYSTRRYSKQTARRMLLSKMFHSTFKIVISVLIISATFYGVYAYFHASLLNDVVVSKSEIVDRVSRLVSLPNEEPQDVVRVEDAEILKKQNSFYGNVKVGDYIIMYQRMAIIYDLRNNTIVAMKKSE